MMLFNKGLKKAKGDLLGFVNSGDTFDKRFLYILRKYYQNHANADFFFGSVRKHWGIFTWLQKVENTF